MRIYRLEHINYRSEWECCSIDADGCVCACVSVYIVRVHESVSDIINPNRLNEREKNYV